MAKLGFQTSLRGARALLQRAGREHKDGSTPPGEQGLWPQRPPSLSRLSISQRTPGTSVGWERRKKRRLFELAKPKTNWQVLKDR